MTVEEYARLQAEITAKAVSAVLSVAQFFLSRRRNLRADWLFFLDLVWPDVQTARRESAELGRAFLDGQRAEKKPKLPRHDALLAGYRKEWFAEAMEPVRKPFTEVKDGAAEMAALRAATEVENGGRRTIIRAVEDDREAVAWARVATGRETCEFCLTMISRGPAFLSAEGAGLNADDTTAIELWRRGDHAALDELMTRWHPGCDCKVVPVFDRRDWPGRAEYLRALDVWRKYSREVDNHPEMKTPQNGNQHGDNDREWSRSEAVMAAIRRALYSGAIDMRDYAIAA